MGRLLTTAALLATLALSGCSGDGEATTPTPTPSPSVTSPTASPSPTPPALPDAARAHTPEGAEAFVRHFWEVVDYASTNLDPEAIKTLIEPGCTGCFGGHDAIAEVRDGGGRLIGGGTDLSDVRVHLGRAGQRAIAVVRAYADTQHQTVDYPGTEKDRTNPAAKVRFEMVLHQRPASWSVAALKVIS